MLFEILGRMSAVFLVGALGTLGAGSLLGLDAVIAISLAGLLAVASVVEDLSREFLRDGKISRKELNEVFGKFADSTGDGEAHHEHVGFVGDRCPTCGQKIRKKKVATDEIEY